MAKQIINIGSTANDGTGDPIRTAFQKAMSNFDELYTGSTSDVDSLIAGAGISVDQATGNVTVTNTAPDQTVTLTSGANVTITGTYPNFTISSDDVVGAVNSVNSQTGVVVLDSADIAEDTNLYYTEARVSANTNVAANTAKVGITTQQATDITANNAKNTDQTVTLTEGANVTITGTYPDFTIASDDVVGAVNSVNGLAGVVVLDTADIAEDTNLYYTEARVEANSAVALNTAKTGITAQQTSDITANNAKVTANTANVTSAGALMDSEVTNLADVKAFDTTDYLASSVTTITTQQASDITTNNAKTGITSAQAGEITANTAKVTNATHTGDVTGATALTIADDAVITAKILNDNVTHDKLEARYTAEVAISTLTGTVAFDFSAGSSFKIAGDLTGAYTINITNYKKGQVVTIYPLKAQSVTLTAGSGTGVFNKVGGVDYDNTATSILQIECVDDQAANPVFFYSIATFAADPTI